MRTSSIGRSLRLSRLPLLCSLLVLGAFGQGPSNPVPPNVLLLIIDDHAANMVSVFGESGVKTPAMERLAARGVWFTRAYNPAPVCAASRAAFLTGVNPANSGVYFNSQAYRRTDRPIARAETLHGHLRKHGYLVAGYGKINHTGYQDDNLEDFSPGYFKGHNDKKYVTYNDGDLVQHVLPGRLRRLEGLHAAAFGPLPDDWDRDDPSKWQQDTEQAARAVQFLSNAHEQPFFLTVGFWRPHTSRFVPKRYYDLYPLDTVKIPAGYLPGDLDDVPGPGRFLAVRTPRHAIISGAGLWREDIQSKYAATTYVDEQIGRVLDALDRSPHASNTIVILISDNGYHVGEKDHWNKYALWEQTCRVLFAVSGPGITARPDDHPVGVIDLYPTVLGLAGLPPPSSHTLDGVDLASSIKQIHPTSRPPVVSTYGPGNHSLRDARYRYIRYRNGDEELYDHNHDPYEWHNLAGAAAHKETIARLAQWLPTSDAPESAPARSYDGSEITEATYQHWEPDWNRVRPFYKTEPGIIFHPEPPAKR